MGFFTSYNKWAEECLEELREKGHSEEEIKNCEICESGQVHFHRSFYDITGNEYVTPWEKSEHWREA